MSKYFISFCAINFCAMKAGLNVIDNRRVSCRCSDMLNCNNCSNLRRHSENKKTNIFLVNNTSNSKSIANKTASTLDVNKIINQNYLNRQDKINENMLIKNLGKSEEQNMTISKIAKNQDDIPDTITMRKYHQIATIKAKSQETIGKANNKEYIKIKNQEHIGKTKTQEQMPIINVKNQTSKSNLEKEKFNSRNKIMGDSANQKSLIESKVLSNPTFKNKSLGTKNLTKGIVKKNTSLDSKVFLNPNKVLGTNNLTKGIVKKNTSLESKVLPNSNKVLGTNNLTKDIVKKNTSLDKGVIFPLIVIFLLLLIILYLLFVVNHGTTATTDEIDFFSNI